MPIKPCLDLNGVERRLLGRLPAFSPVAIRLLSLLAKESVSFQEISRLIALDPILAGEVMRLANSGLYGRRIVVDSIMSAIAILGCGRLSQIAVTAALWRGLPRRTTPFVRDWWRHSIAAALIARQKSDDQSKDFAYTAALLHGVGQLALFEDAPQDYLDVVESAYRGGTDLLELERDAFGVDHASLAGLIVESWALPETLCEAVKEHHAASTEMPVAEAVQTGCAGAEFAGFGQCGCHGLLAAGIPDALATMFEGDYFVALVAGVNGIECSLV
jgi:HD-like signal output (HDOD) protein